MDPNDRSTWTKEKVHMPTRSSVAFKDFAPKVRSSTSLAWSKLDLYDQAWDAIRDLLGGEDKVAEHTKVLNDSFIINLGHEKYENATIHPRDLDKCVFLHLPRVTSSHVPTSWHVDGMSSISSHVLVFWLTCT
jgi:hypothetical protein